MVFGFVVDCVEKVIYNPALYFKTHMKTAGLQILLQKK